MFCSCIPLRCHGRQAIIGCRGLICGACESRGEGKLGAGYVIERGFRSLGFVDLSDDLVCPSYASSFNIVMPEGNLVDLSLIWAGFLWARIRDVHCSTIHSVTVIQVESSLVVEWNATRWIESH